MLRPRAVLAVVVVYTLFLLPVNGSTSAPVGTITSANSAHVGSASASSGSTVFGGDHLSTEKFGSLQVRAGAARFMLSSASSAAVDGTATTPSARLLSGTVVFSTANSRAFLLYASKAEIRPQSDQPTVAQVTYVNDKELQVRSTRGSLAITVEGETQIVPEAMAYRVILDPESYYAAENAQGPRGVGTRQGGPPLRAGKSHFLLIAIIVISIATGVALYEALQSPDAPH
jgi:energy-coupling factor transporter transmembrane protein EcfT